MSWPFQLTSPRLSTMPMMALAVVERPEPLRPSRATISPPPTSNSTPCRTWLLPYQACRLFVRRIISVHPRLLVGDRRAQVGLLHLLVGPHHLRRVVGDDLAVDHH